jgi:prepilin-type N-terminal cleavage/methylation domain-containing protein
MSRNTGFTLAEMAVAVVILALLLFGAMMPFSSQLEIRNIAETRRTLDSTREAIIGFAQANGRLPCPADGSIPAGALNAGTEQYNVASSSCSAVTGVVPWVTLGTSETDAWSHRLTYRVSPAFADGANLTTWNTRSGAYSPPAGYLTQAPGVPNPTASKANQSPACDLKVAPTQSSFALCTLGDIAVFTRTTSAAVPLATAIPAIIVSHGKNGRGAWQANGIRLPAPAAGTDEAANVNGNTFATPSGSYTSWAFYSRNPTPAATGCVDPTPPGTTSASPLCEFDDIVATISSTVLIARAVAAGKLP